MKKTLLLLILFPLLFAARASDTLTVSQVFDFAVGDTFDYINIQTSPQSLSIFDTTYSRTVIVDKLISQSGDSIRYTRKDIYPDTNTRIEVYHGIAKHIDLYNYEVYGRAPDIINIAISVWDSIYYEFDGDIPGVYDMRYFTKGLGLTHKFMEGTDYGNFFSTDLMYYTKGNRHAGTPYYSFTTGIGTIDISSIHLYPTPTTDILHLSYSEASQHDTRLIITDLLCREVYSSPVIQSETTHDISRLPSGIYTWHLTSDDMIVKTGKVIKE